MKTTPMLRLACATALLWGCLMLHSPAWALPLKLWEATGDKPSVVGAYLSMGYWDEREVEDTFAELERLGVNLVIDYALVPPEDESFYPFFRHYLDSARIHHVGIAFSLYPVLTGMTVEHTGTYIDDVVDLVRELADEPAITAWYVHDEVLPSIKGDGGTKHYSISLEQMRSLYLRIRSADPTRPQLCVWNYLPDQEQFNKVYNGEALPGGWPAWMQREESYERALKRMVQTTCDWVLIDCYPVGAPWRDDTSPAPEQDVADIVARIAAMKKPEQPLVFVFQAFSWEQYNKEKAQGAPFPTVKQMQAMLHAARSSGAGGVVGYSWFDLAEAVPGREELKGRQQALGNLRAVLFSLARQGWP